MTYRGPDVRANGSFDARSDLAKHLHTSFEGRRNLWDALGYSETSKLSFSHFWSRYQREGLATALVGRFVTSTWQTFPDIGDRANVSDESDTIEAATETETAFEASVRQFISGEALRREYGTSLRHSIQEAVALADTYATLGHYSLLFLGFADGEDTDLSDPVVENSLDGLDGLAYVTPVSEDQVTIDQVESPSNPRYGLPKRYDIQFDDSVSETVHYSRVIHIPEGTRQSELKGTPTYLKGWNRFDDLEKLLGGSAEQAWRGAFMGLTVTPPRDADGNLMRFPEDDTNIEEQVEEYRHDLRRVIRTTGEVDVLQPAIEDVSDTIRMHLQALSAAYDIPQSIYLGNETGERATQEDRKQWAETIASRRSQFAEEHILRPLIDRLRFVGVLDDPSGDDYTIEWISLTELSEEEWATLLKTKAQAIDLISAGQPDRLFSEQELRSILGYSTERGSPTEDTADDGPMPDPAASIDEEMAADVGGLAAGERGDE